MEIEFIIPKEIIDVEPKFNPKTKMYEVKADIHSSKQESKK